MKYTKGEWIVDYGGTIGHIKAVSAEKTPTVCRYSPPPNCALSIPQEEQDRNAHLIAAAPDMYEALKDIQQLCAESAFTQDVKRQIIAGKCYLARAKAEGK